MDDSTKLKFKGLISKNKNIENASRSNTALPNTTLLSEEKSIINNNILNNNNNILNNYNYNSNNANMIDKGRNTAIDFNTNNILSLNYEQEDYTQEKKELLTSNRHTVYSKQKMNSNLRGLLNKEFLKSEGNNGSEQHKKNALINYELSLESKLEEDSKVNDSKDNDGKLINTNKDSKENIIDSKENKETIIDSNENTSKTFDIKVKKDDDSTPKDFSDRMKMFNSKKPNPLLKSASEKIISYNYRERKSAMIQNAKIGDNIVTEGRKSVKDLIKMNERKVSGEINFDEDKKSKESKDTNSIPMELRSSVSEHFSKNLIDIKNYLTNFNLNDIGGKSTEELKKLGIDESGNIII